MKRARGLFARLLVAQVLLVILLTATLALLFYTERNRTVAQLVATHWTPALQLVASGAPIEQVRARAPGPLLLSSGRPDDALEIASLTPRATIVRETLAEQGLPVVDLVFGQEREATAVTPMLWVALRTPEGAIRWVGFESGVVETRLRLRLVLAVLLLFGLAIAASALIAWRLARPLEALRARIAADDASGGALAHASAEVQAIDEAWRGLRLSLDRQERERALLLAGVSHDLRSPLGRIRMAAELLQDGEGVAIRRDAIVRNAQLADRLVGSFLDHVRSGELPLEETVDVAAVARAVATDEQRPAGELTVDAPASVVVHGANAVLIERLLANLIDNACTHGRPPVVVRVATLDGSVCIDVEDHGDGIAAERPDAMLQAFARADTSRGRPGLGLGLAIVQRVAHRLGGSVAFLRSADGRRHVVRVQWPGR